jgi:effector-binding domain-containing protein
MKALKIVVGILALILVAYLVLCLLGPTRVQVERSQTMNAPASLIYQQISDFKKWPAWSPWSAMDPSMEYTYGEVTQGEGASYTWSSEKMGNGGMEILEAKAPAQMKTKIKFDNWEGYSYGSWSLKEQEDGSTQVSWGLEGDTDIPFMVRGMLLVMGMESSIEEDFDKGLGKLKSISEEAYANLPTSYRGYEIMEKELPGMTYAAIRDRLSWDVMQSFIAQSYMTIMQALGNRGIEMAGPPTNLYYDWDTDNQRADMAAAMPIESIAQLGEDIEIIDLPAGKVITLDYLGDYDKMEDAYYALEDYANDRGLEILMPAVEEYVTDPGSEPDTSKWLTRISHYYQ